MHKAVVLLSGGMDSTTLAYYYVDRGLAPISALSFDYGQRHRTELHFAARTAHRLHMEHDIVDLSSLGNLLSGSSLTDSGVDVPDGHYTEESMKATVVPNRNAIMLSVAVGIAVARGADIVGAAMHAGDHAVYPDCRPEFLNAFDDMARIATAGFAVSGLHVEAPFIYSTKADIATIGDQLGVPWNDTWSCYKGDVAHCGRCGTCVERAEAFSLAGVEDPTYYVDPTYWRDAVASA